MRDASAKQHHQSELLQKTSNTSNFFDDFKNFVSAREIASNLNKPKNVNQKME
jgi:hypothetical protein